MTLMFGGIPLAAVVPPPWNAIALLVPYFLSIGLMMVAPIIVQNLINRDRLIRPTIQSTENKYISKIYHWWLQFDPMDDPDASLDPGYFEYNSIKGQKHGGYSQVPLKFKEPFMHPKYGKLWKVYVRFKGEWPKRMTHKGCKANRWGQYGMDHNHGDEATFYELRKEFYRDVPVVELTGMSYPVYKLKLAPGDLKAEEDEMRKELKFLTTPMVES